MNREDLTEAVAKAMHAQVVEYPSIAGMGCAYCRANAEAAVPAIVDFVSEWLEVHGEARAMMTWCNEMDQPEDMT